MTRADPFRRGLSVGQRVFGLADWHRDGAWRNGRGQRQGASE